MGRDWVKYQARVVMKIYFTRKISKRRIHTYSNNLNPQVETCTFKMPDRLVSVYIVRVLLCFLFNSFFPERTCRNEKRNSSSKREERLMIVMIRKFNLVFRLSSNLGFACLQKYTITCTRKFNHLITLLFEMKILSVAVLHL